MLHSEGEVCCLLHSEGVVCCLLHSEGEVRCLLHSEGEVRCLLCWLVSSLLQSEGRARTSGGRREGPGQVGEGGKGQDKWGRGWPVIW